MLPRPNHILTNSLAARREPQDKRDRAFVAAIARLLGASNLPFLIGCREREISRPEESSTVEPKGSQGEAGNA